VLNPYFFLNVEKALEVTSVVSRRYGAGAFRLNVYPLFYLYQWGITRLPFISIMVGFVFAVCISPARTLFLLTYIAPFLYVFLYYMSGGTYVRNFSTVIPFLMLFAGYPFGLLLQALKKHRGLGVIGIGVLLFVIHVHTLRNAIVLDVSYVTPWVRDTLTRWVLRNVPEGSRILNDNVGVPTSIDKSVEIVPWGYDEGNAITELMDNGYDFAVLNIAWNHIYFFWFNTPPRKLINHGVPYDELWNSYRGLLLSEYFRYAVAEFYKPWQAPENSYLVMKIPRKPQLLGMVKARFELYQDANGWVSPKIAVVPGKLYTVEGFIKANVEIPSNLRDGFFQLDFFSNQPLTVNWPPLRKSLQTAVSGRIYGPSQWMKRRIIAVAPDQATHLTVSFQAEHQDIQYSIGTVAIYESDETLTYTSDMPLVQQTMPIMNVFPNSIY